MKQNPSKKTIKFAISVLLATSLLVLLTAAASADSQKVKWSGTGLVVYVGPSQDPTMPTSAEARFKLNRDGGVRSVVVETTNEQFVAVLGGGPEGGAITECRDRKGSQACDGLNSLLTGSFLASLHNSTATLSRISQSEIQIPIQTPFGPVVLNVPVLSGQLSGKLHGQFGLSNGTGILMGTADLRIGRGSSGTYACFGESPFGPIPLESLDPCIDNSGGQLFPIVLDVTDSGKFELGAGEGSMADILGIKGQVTVKAQTNLLDPLGPQFGGSVAISKAVTRMVGDDGSGDKPEHDDDDDD